MAVTDYLTPIQEWLADTRLARQVTEALLHTCGRRHLARFDRLSAARCQNRILLGLVHRARLTRFGLDHRLFGRRALTGSGRGETSRGSELEIK